MVFGPDAIGAVPFIRNANGAMVLPPVQAKPLLNRILVFRPSDVADIPRLVNRRLVPVLKTHSLEDSAAAMREADPGEDPATLWPTDILCWHVERAELLPVTLAEPWRDASRWAGAVHEGLRRVGCE